ncbi:unnamed protein product, partial [Rotaria magnacalcarata]
RRRNINVASQPFLNGSPMTKNNYNDMYSQSQNLTTRGVSRRGYQEIIYEKDQPKKQRKYYLRPRPTEVFIDSDDEDKQQQMQYVKLIKHRTTSQDVLPRRDPSPKYIMIRTKSNSQPVYAFTSKMPAIKNNRRVVYEVPTKNR